MTFGGRNVHVGSSRQVVQTNEVHGGVHIYNGTPVASRILALPRVGLFVGRRTELSNIVSTLVEEETDVRLAGPPGVGKTTLALKAAHTVLNNGYFPGGALYVGLHGYSRNYPLNPLHALDQLLSDLGVPPERIPATLDAKANRYRSTLAERHDPLLVIVDNAISADQVVPLLPSSGAHRVIVTSRCNLSEVDTSRLIEVNVLNQSESLELISAALADSDPKDERALADPDAAEDLSAACGHLPLALRVVTANLVSDKNLSISTMLTELHDSYSVVSALKAGSLDVQPVFGYSYRNLEGGEARLFRHLALYPGENFDVRSSAALSGFDIPLTRRLIRALANAHLIESTGTPGRYKFHDLIRSFARECAGRDETSNERDAAIVRLFEYYIDRSKLAGRHLDHTIPRLERASAEFPEQADALNWFDLEQQNIASMGLFVTLRRERLIQICELFIAAARYFQLRTYSVDPLVGLIPNLSRLLSDNPLDSHKATLQHEYAHSFLRGVCLNFQGYHRAAIDAYFLALVVAQGIGDSYECGSLMVDIGVCYGEMEDYALKVTYISEAFRIFRKCDLRGSAAYALELIAKHHYQFLAYGGAIEYLSESAKLYRKDGDRLGQARVCKLLATVYLSVNRYVEAKRELLRCVQIYRSLDERLHRPYALSALGRIYQSQKSTSKASEAWAEALALFMKNGDKLGASLVRRDITISNQSKLYSRRQFVLEPGKFPLISEFD